MPKSAAYSNDFLKLTFNGTPIAGLADNAASNPFTKLYLTLHTSDPGESGTQSTNEVSYTGYARKEVLRDGTGWTVTGKSVSPTAAVEFGEMTAGTPGVATHVSVGTSLTGTGKILYYGTITPQVSYNVGVVPRIRTTSTITES